MLSLSQTHDHQLAINYLIFKWHPEILRLTNVIDQFISETVKKKQHKTVKKGTANYMHLYRKN